MDGRELRLPKWVQDELARLRSSSARLEKQLRTISSAGEKEQDKCEYLLAALEKIRDHSLDTCLGIHPRDCLDTLQEIARAAIVKTRGE